MPTTRPLAIAPLPMPIASVHPIGFPLMAISNGTASLESSMPIIHPVPSSFIQVAR